MNLLKLTSDKYCPPRKLVISLTIVTVWLLVLTVLIRANPIRMEINTAYFYPSEKPFREIYGPHLKYGLDLGMNIWQKVELHFEANYFFKKGHLTFTRETTRLKLVPFSMNLRYLFWERSLSLYAGLGVSYLLFEEKNPLGKIKAQKGGPMIKIGAFKRIRGLKKWFKTFVINAFLSYHYCPMEPAQIKFDAGGIDLGLGLGFEF